jgi:hypothetical protein
MGYTHYWNAKESTTENWTKFKNTCQKLKDNLPEKTDIVGGYYSDDLLEIAGPMGDGEPIFNNTTVAFNGKDGEKDLGHESFMINKSNSGGEFCKTAQKPYDLLVVACLIAAWQILDYRFSSDGFNRDETCEDLQSGIDYYNKIIQPEILITQELLAKQRREK